MYNIWLYNLYFQIFKKSSLHVFKKTSLQKVSELVKHITDENGHILGEIMILGARQANHGELLIPLLEVFDPV